jgi:NTE family protein
MSLPKNHIALVLGSGGARGLAHIGVIKALEEHNIPIDFIAGTSIGAFIGGLYASGISAAALESLVWEVDKMMIARIFKPKIFAPGVIDNKRIAAFIKDIVGNVKIENMKIPFAAVATDFVSGKEVVIDKGYLTDAVMASIAIPALFQPVYLNSRFLLDGGLSNPLPISVAKEMKAEKIIAVNVSPDPERITKRMKTKKTEEVRIMLKKMPSLFAGVLSERKRPAKNDLSAAQQPENIDMPAVTPTLLNVFLQTISISTHNLITQRLLSASPDVLLSPKIENYDLLEFYRGEEIVKCGYEAAISEMPAIRSCMPRGK